MSVPNFEQFALAEVLADSNQVIGIVGPDMIVRWASRSAAAYDLDVIGRSILDIVHPEDLARVTRAFDVRGHLAQSEPSLMSNAIVSIRLITPAGIVPFDATARWVRDDQGHAWLVAILHDVTTRHAVDLALRRLAAGADEQASMHAVITASHDYGGVVGAQMTWQSDDGTTRTFGDLGAHPQTVSDELGDLRDLGSIGRTLDMAGSEWGFVLPVSGGVEQLGGLALWGIGPPPDIQFVHAAFAPLLDIAALALKRSREQAALRRQAMTDLATGLMNRHGFFSALDAPLTCAAVMYIDLDGFKAVNDELGHTLGDRLLRVVSRRLADAVGEHDLLGRIGGDEFAVLCRTATPGEAHVVADRIIGALNHTFVIDGHHIVTGASVGVAYTDCATHGRTLLDQADQALLEAKAQGKGRAVVFATL